MNDYNNEKVLETYRDLFIYTEDALLERIESLERYVVEKVSLNISNENSTSHLKNKVSKLKQQLAVIQKDHEESR